MIHKWVRENGGYEGVPIETGYGPLSFASPERLRKYFDLGAVSILAIMSDKASARKDHIDKDLRPSEVLACHSLVN